MEDAKAVFWGEWWWMPVEHAKIQPPGALRPLERCLMVRVLTRSRLRLKHVSWRIRIHPRNRMATFYQQNFSSNARFLSDKALKQVALGMPPFPWSSSRSHGLVEILLGGLRA